MSCKGASLLTLTQALAIKANQYRSSDNKRDYEAFEVDERINYLQSRKDERANSMALKSHARFEANKAELNTVKTLETNETKTYERFEVITEIKEYWKIVGPNGFSYQIIEIPPQIINF